MSDSSVAPKDLAKKTKKSMLWYTTIPFSVHLIRFVNSIILARILAPGDFGIIGIISVILYYCDTYSNFGFSAALVQRKNIDNSHYHSFFTFNLGISFIFFFTVIIFARNIADFFEVKDIEQALPVYAILFLFSALSAIPLIKLKRYMNYKIIAIADAAKVCCSIPVSLTLALNGFGFWAIIIASLVAQFAALLILFYKSNYTPKLSFDFSPLRQLFNFSLWSFLNGQFKLLSDNIDKLIIGKVLGVDALGYYDKAMGLVKMPYDQVAMRLSNVSFATFSRIQEDRLQISNYFNKINSLNNLLMLPILVGLIWVAQPLVLLLLGEKWLPIVPTFKIFAVTFIFASFNSQLLSVTFAINKIKQITLVRIILTIILIPSLIFSAKFGIEIIAINIFVFQVLLFIALLFIFASYLGSKFYLLIGTYIISSLPTFIMLTFLYALALTFPNSSAWWDLLSSLVFGALIYLISIFFIPLTQFKPIKKQIMELLNKV